MFTRGIITALIVVFLDQAHKWYMLEVVNIRDTAPLYVTSFFNLVMVWNRGISFGMFRGLDYSHYIFAVLAFGISGILIHWLRSVTNTYVAFSIGAVIGGAMGNVVDRLRFHAVADFLDFHVAGYHWPAFNIADACIFTGAVILCIHSVFYAETEKKSRKKPAKATKKTTRKKR